ncbi:unnamed protein product [Orchesella dallaii]|uniref:Uncharacterized protein n=1 Tax=Orchesella dallaii TaxID=48710 RepID=A0ABP1QN50_9HEXA
MYKSCHGLMSGYIYILQLNFKAFNRSSELIQKHLSKLSTSSQTNVLNKTMRLTFGSRKQLKRVSGEVRLVAIKDDPQRPPTGVPLRRCSNKAHINLLQDSISTLNSSATEDSNASPDIVYSNATDSTDIQYGGVGEREIYPFPNTPTQCRFGTSTSEKIVVPNNSAVVTPAKTNSFNFADSVKTRLHKAPLQYKTYRKPEVPRTRDTFTVDNCSSVGPTLSKFQSLTETVESSTPKNVEGCAANPAQVLIATATSLDLPESNIALSSRPSKWSLKNQAATPKSPTPSSSTLRNDNEGTEKKLATSTTTSPMSSNTGDGDSSSVPSNSRPKKGVQALPPKAPPPSAATTIRSPLKFTFRKPKLRPRSIITSGSGSGRASLPTTASTPNPIMPQTPPEEAREVPINNNNNDIDNNNNTNIVQAEEAQLQLVAVNNDKNNNDTVKPKSSKEKVPSAIFAVEKDAVKGKEFIVMPAEVVPAQPTAAEVEPQQPDGYYEVEEVDQSFWNSDSTPPSENHDPEQSNLPRASHVAKTSNGDGSKPSSDLYESNSGYDYTSKKYPVSGYGSQINPSGYGGANGTPFLTTEKGAIRFHLPGRIQHKTTIKVAHFPTGDEKNVVVNLKPDKEEDVYCDPPNCANNQNFVVQQPSYPPPAPYGSYPYGYGYGAPNYYGYGGYPPYY